ncbi:MAG: rhomboid family intramembrane serine protease [Crocinitomicaceae bacterium]|nr:rhomboid family intramembrane serine protease [Crocinitomicaceae bacterium]MDG1777293.1 rhomboid family intramembrane serine protease [Crocinitomicaceae bacterium]
MERNFIAELRHQYKYGGAAVQLIFINVSIFLAIRIIDVFFNLTTANENIFIDNYASHVVGLHTNIIDFSKHPWGLFTSIFTHYSLMHLLFNMVFLYFSGKLFLQLFDKRRLITTYILGGLIGGLFEVLAHSLFPKLQLFDDIVLGASGAIMAIFVAIAFHRPQLKINLFGVIPVRMIVLAVLFILVDLLALDKKDGTAHFAHLGGAVLGVISIQNIQSPKNIVNLSQKLWDTFKTLFQKRSTKFKVTKGGKANERYKTDEEYNIEEKSRQIQVDKILDKISKSGYESLTKKEKKFLFNQSKNG